jgi:hypothetical protein
MSVASWTDREDVKIFEADRERLCIATALCYCRILEPQEVGNYRTFNLRELHALIVLPTPF